MLAIISCCFIICYFCCTKHHSKQNHLLQYHDTINKFKEVDINNIF